MIKHELNIKFTCPVCNKNSYLSEQKFREVTTGFLSRGKCKHCDSLFYKNDIIKYTKKI